MLPKGENPSSQKQDLGPSKQESQPQQNPSRKGERSRQRTGDGTLSVSSQDVPSVSPQMEPGTAGTARPRTVCAGRGLAITEGGKAQLGLLFPCSNFSSIGKLLKGRDGVSS